jgi:hypothetical protein
MSILGFVDNHTEKTYTFTMNNGGTSIDLEFEKAPEGPTPSTEEFLEIGGTRWATRNIAEPNTFATNPTDAGWYYQYGIRFAWSGAGVTSPASGVTFRADAYWPGANGPIPNVKTYSAHAWTNNESGSGGQVDDGNPCPDKYIVPTPAEYKALFEATTNEFATIGGVKGRLVIDKTNTSKILFFPAAGFYTSTPTVATPANVGTHGYYWTNTGVAYNGSAMSIGVKIIDDNESEFTYPAADVRINRFYIQSVRCVQEKL